MHMHDDLRRTYGEDFLLRGIAHPISHTLDLAFGYWCTAKVAATSATARSPSSSTTLAARWTNAFDPATGLLIDSTFYEGGKWNYSFRLLHDMAPRIAARRRRRRRSSTMLDRFFGFGAEPRDAAGLRRRSATSSRPATRSTASRG